MPEYFPMKHSLRFVLTASVLGMALATAPACDGNELVLGSTPGRLELRPGDAYDGYIENFHFASGSDVVRISLSSSTAGTLTFGSAPGAAWSILDNGRPERPNMESLDLGQDARTVGARLEGFSFSLKDLRLEETRLRFSIDLSEPWRAWCPAQTPLEISRGHYECLRAQNAEPVSDDDRSRGLLVNADRSGPPNLCSGPDQLICACDAAGCRLHEHLVGFDLRLGPNTAEGSSPLGHVHFTNTTLGPPPSPPAVNPVGSWTGSFDSYRFGSGSDALTVDFTSAGGGSVSHGQAATGQDPVDHTWFASTESPRPEIAWADFGFTAKTVPHLPFFRKRSEAFAHTLRDVRIDGSRVLFRINLMESWAPRCSAQRSHVAMAYFGTEVTTCLSPEPSTDPNACLWSKGVLHNFATDPAPPNRRPADCLQAALCGNPFEPLCACDGQRCQLSHTDEPLYFDMRIDGDEAVGTSDLGRFHLKRR